jgi:plasmid replication initiation protein
VHGIGGLGISEFSTHARWVLKQCRSTGGRQRALARKLGAHHTSKRCSDSCSRITKTRWRKCDSRDGAKCPGHLRLVDGLAPSGKLLVPAAPLERSQLTFSRSL